MGEKAGGRKGGIIFGRRLILNVFFCLVVLPIIFLIPRKVYAVESSVYISEIMWRGSSVSSADEWVELQNPTDKIISLNGWCLRDEYKSENMLCVENGEIPANGYFLISNNSKDHKFTGGESVLNIDPDYISTDLSLSNSNFQISLLGSSGEQIDEAGDGGKPFYYKEIDSNYISIYRLELVEDGQQKSSWQMRERSENLDDGVTDLATPHNSGKIIIEKFDIGNYIELHVPSRIQFKIDTSNDDYSSITITDSFGNKFDLDRNNPVTYKKCPVFTLEVISQTGLKSSASLTSDCIQTSKNIFISEVFPSPKDGKEEWIELANKRTGPIDLNKWYIKDKSGKIYILPEIKIDGLNYVVLKKSQTKLSLNNSNETLSLFDPNGLLVDRINYKSVPHDFSWAKWGESYYLTQIPTLGQENIIESGSSPKIIYDPKQLEENLGKNVTLEVKVDEIDRENIIADFGGEKVYLSAGKGLGDISQYLPQSVISVTGRLISNNPFVIKVESIKVKDKRDKNSQKESEYIVTTKIKQKVTYKAPSKEKIKVLSAMERPPNDSQNLYFLVKLLIALVVAQSIGFYYVYYSEK